MAGNQANVEYFFRLLYDLIYGPHAALSFEGFKALLSQIWLWIVYIGYAVSALALFLIIYESVRLAELRKREKEFYSTLITTPEKDGAQNPRWKHIETLAAGTSQSEWREAIIEADIMLDELLTQQGYEGESLADRLNAAEHSNLASSKNAWEAHRVRNQIAHQGSTFTLSQELVQRTISHYETVFREMNAI